MKSASGNITLKKATRKDIKEITELIYITEPEPELEWGYGTELEKKEVLENLMQIRNNRFSLKNFIVARKDNKLIGMALLIEGKDIDRLTINSEKKVVKIQKGFLNKLGYIYSSIRDYFLFRECEIDEFYISNIAIKKEYKEQLFFLQREFILSYNSLFNTNDFLLAVVVIRFSFFCEIKMC